MRRAGTRIWHKAGFVLLTLGTGALTYWLCGKEPVFFEVGWHRDVLVHTCAVAATVYVLATIVQRNWFWALTAGCGGGTAVNMILEGIRPKGWIFWPFIDSAMQGTAGETILWLYGNCLILIIITGLALAKIRI